MDSTARLPRKARFPFLISASYVATAISWGGSNAAGADIQARGPLGYSEVR
jgi:hypothetical protein